MLDQSFTTRNLEVIFDLENRKGNIDLDWMPVEYRDAVDSMKNLCHQISILKSKARKKSDEDVKRIAELEQAYITAKEKKENSREVFLKKCEDKINSKDFEIKMNKFLDADSNKEVFTLNLNEPAVFFTLKQLQYNIHKTFKDPLESLNITVPFVYLTQDVHVFESVPLRLEYNPGGRYPTDDFAVWTVKGPSEPADFSWSRSECRFSASTSGEYVITAMSPDGRVQTSIKINVLK